jgi:hypothetical protein
MQIKKFKKENKQYDNITYKVNIKANVKKQTFLLW